MFRGAPPTLSFALAFVVLSSPALADEVRPRGGYEWANPALVDVAEPQNHSSNVIFLNRCETGCTISAGYEDSRSNRSSIIGGTVNIQPFEHGDQAWDAVVRCVAEIYEPYDIVITDEDPGNQSHFEAIVAGHPSDIGRSGIGGVAPFSCGIINNSITYSFANIYGSTRDICETVAQETAHAFGLEHEFLCEDPMTYLSGCGEKWFRDIDAQCGEFSARACDCGGSSQNSHRLLLGHFDAGQPTPPTVGIVKPENNALVQPSFAVVIEAEDNIGIEKVDLYMNERHVASSNIEPFAFNAPEDMPGGEIQVRAVATDNRGETSETTIWVVMGDPCTQDSCGEGLVCLGGRCVDGPSTPGGLGSRCTGHDDCESGMCGNDGTDQFCSSPCVEGECPSGFACVAAGDQGVCWPSAEEEGGCAATGADGGTGLFGLALMFICGLVLRRRKSA